MAEQTAKIPQHVGFIMDGNGRWAKLHNKPRSYGHQKGAEVIHEVVSACFNRGIKVVSLYAFSTENWSRPQDEIDKIFDLLRSFLKKYHGKLISEKIGLIISGDISKIPEKLALQCNVCVKETKNFRDHILNIAINYGSRTELVRAVNHLIDEGKKDITESDIDSKLYTAGLPDIDLVVRTSGEKRLSNFFLWQCAYAEFYFTDVLWPDFHEECVGEAIEWFSERKRRFGGV